MFIASVISALAVVIAFDGYGIIESEAVFGFCTFIPSYLLYYSFVCRYNDIGRFQKAVYVFFLFLLISQLALVLDINSLLPDIDEDTAIDIWMVETANFIFGILLLLFGFFKKGKFVLQDATVSIPDRIGTIKKENLVEVNLAHKPDFSTHGLVLVYNDIQRVIMSAVDRDMLQPDTLRGARLFEFSLRAVNYPE